MEETTPLERAPLPVNQATPPGQSPDGPATGRCRLSRRHRAMKNLVTLGLAFVLMFTSYQGLSAIQSSFNSSGGLGTAGLAVTYASVVASSLVVPPLVIGRLGPKRTMLAALIGYLVYLCANLYPHWGTIIPASALLGLCAGPLWAGTSVYVVRLAEDFGASTDVATEPDGSRDDSAVPIFFGVFFTFFASCSVWGNLVSFLALSGHQQQRNATAPGGNFSCGFRFCPADGDDEADSELERPPMSQFYIMMTCFIATAGLSILVMLALVDRTDNDSDRRSFSLAQLRDNVRAMAAHVTDTRQLLLLIITVNVGLSQSFALGDFTEGFVACSSGIGSVGQVMMCYGAGQVVSGVVFGHVARKLGKAPVLVATSCVHLTLQLVALFWHVAPKPSWYFFVFALAWGCVDTVWNSQLNALYGDYFSSSADAAFSVYRFCESLGYIVGFSYNKLLCIDQKLQVMLTVLSVGTLGLIASVPVDRRMRKSRIGGSFEVSTADTDEKI